MPIKIDMSQQDPPSLLMKGQEMDAVIAGDYHGRIGKRHSSMKGQDPMHHDVESGSVDCGVGEWRIPPLRTMCHGEPSPGFRNRDFRNPHTGLSIIPTQVYAELLRDLRKACRPYNICLWIFLVLVFQVTVVWIPFTVIGDVHSSLYYKLARVAGSLYLGSVIWKIGRTCFGKAMHRRIERLVQEHQGKLMECGVKLGSSRETTEHFWNRSRLWLRLIPESHPSTLTKKNGRILESTSVEKPQRVFPPIFMTWFIPGEIHINEKEYDPSMVIDQEVWNMIRQAHVGSFKLYHCFLNFLLVGLLLIFIGYMTLIFYFMYRFGGLKALLGCMGLFSGCVLTFSTLYRLNGKACSQVADDVTLLLLNHENPNLNGLRLKFETSALPFRGSWSRRYQLVQVPRSIAIHSAMVDDGK